MEYKEIGPKDRKLIEAARGVLRKSYRAERHTVGAAVLCSSGRIYAGVNVEACGYGPCAEAIAMGSAFSNGETKLVAIVAVHKKDSEYPVLSPCGNCRQMIFDYAPEAMVILNDNGKVRKMTAHSLLPAHYRLFE